MNATVNRWLAALLMVLVVPASLAAVEAGKIVYAYGEAHAIDAGGTSRGLQKDDVVFPGDTLRTGKGRLQVRFADGGFISLQPGSEFRVEEFRFSGKEDGTESAFFRLVKGGLRAITGLIGHRHKKSYRLRTALATIGIRGTAFRVRLCQGDCFRPDGSPLPDGLYTKTGEGVIFVQNDAGVIDLPAGMASYVRDRATPPKPARDLPPMAKAGQRGGKGLRKARRAARRDAAGGGSGGFRAGEQLTADGGNQALGGAAAPLLYGFTISPSNATPSVTPPDGHADTRVDGVPPTFAVTYNPETGGYVGHSIGTAYNVDAFRGEGLFITRWTGGTTYDTDDGPEVLSGYQSTHILAGVYPSMPTAATASYSFVAGTSSTSADGSSVGAGMTGGTLGVDFVNQTVIATSLTVVHGSTYVIDSYSPMPLQVVTAPSGKRGLIFEGTPSYFTCLPSCTAAISGALYGTSGSGSNVAPSSAGLVYMLGSGPGAIQGAAAFQRYPPP